MSESTVQPFEFRGNQLRALTDTDGNPWFIAKDVCDILGLRNNRDAISQLDSDEKSSVAISDGTSGNPNKTIISEPGLYRLIMRSRKPDAKDFQRWVTHEVLPQIRRTGGYLPANAAETPEETLSRAILIAQRTIEDKQHVIDRQRPLALLGEAFVSADGTMSITQASRHLRTLDPRMTRDTVYGILRGGGYVETRSNAPTMKAVKPGYLKAVTPTKADGTLGRQYARFTTKGVNWFIDRYIYGHAQGRLEGIH